MQNYIFHESRLEQTMFRSVNQGEQDGKHRRHQHSRTSSAPGRDLRSFADEYRKLAIDCLKVLRVEMQLETTFHIQVREFPSDFVVMPEQMVK